MAQSTAVAGAETAAHVGAVSQRRVLVAVALAYSIDQLGMLPITAVLGAIGRDFGSGLESTSWVVAGYLLVMSSLLLPAGRLGDLLGHTRVFRAGIITSTVGAILASVVPNLWLLIAARAVQGLGSALILSCSLAIISAAFPLSWRGRAIGIVVTASFAASVAGLVFGTFFSEVVDWRLLLLTIVPLGLAALAAALPLQDHAPVQRPSFDVAGSVFFVLFIGALSLSMSHLHGGEATFAADWLYHTTLQVVALASLGIFIVVERRAATPLVDVRHFRRRVFSGSLVVNFLLHMTMLSVWFLLPLYVPRMLGLPLSASGILLIVVVSTALATTWVGGVLQDLADSRWLRPVFMAFVASALALLGLMPDRLSYELVMAILVFAAIGNGLLLTMNNTVIVSSVPADLRGFATGMLETGRQLGHAFGVTIATSALSLGVGGIAVADATRSQLASGFQWAWLVMAGLAAAGVICAVPHFKKQL